jgi:hypothetical protein
MDMAKKGMYEAWMVIGMEEMMGGPRGEGVAERGDDCG